MDDKDRFSARFEIVEQGDDRGLGCRIDAGERFVHQVKIAFLCECAREKDALLLPSGEIRDLAFRVRQHLDFLETFPRDSPILGRRPADQTETAIPTHQNDIHHVDRKIPVHRFALRDIADAGQRFFERLPEHFDPAAARRDHAHDRFDQCRFARAVWADNSDEPSRGHFQIDSVEHRFFMIRDSKIMDLERERFRCALLI